MSDPIQDALRSALAARLARNPQMDEAFGTMMQDMTTETLSKATDAKERIEARWETRSAHLLAQPGVTEQSLVYLKAAASYQSSLDAWDRHLSTIAS